MKISKTLKRLRAEKGITQEQLAEQLFISRQSVSSWENDRTQPDLEMLGKLSEVFGVSVEELVYGKKRNVTLETEKPNYNSTLIIVFSILGALLAGTGLVLIFVTFWQKMPLLIKAVLSLLPLIAGQAAGVFVLAKKKDKIPWCEGAGVLWCAGIAATLAMIYNIFNLGFYWQSILVIVSILIIPVILLLNCASPVAVYYGCTIAWFTYEFDEGSPYLKLALTVLLTAAGCVFTSRLVKKEKKSIRSLYSHWVSIAAVIALSLITASGFNGDFIFIVAAAAAAALCLLLISLKEPDIAMPYRIPGLLLTSLFLFAGGATYYGNLDREKENIILTAVMIFAVILTLAFIIFTKTKSKDKFLNSYIAVGGVAFLAFSVISYYMPDFASKSSNDEIFITAMKIIAIAGNIILMISGGRDRKLLPINTGFVSVSALTFLIVYQSDLSMTVNGLLLLLCGAVLLFINYKLSRKPKKAPVTVNTEEVADNE